MDIYKLYCLKHPVTGELRYIGHTKQTLKERLRGHLKCRQHNKRTSWLQHLRNTNLTPVIELLYESTDRDHIIQTETRVIKGLLKRKYRLVNTEINTRTREGFRHSEATKRLLSEKAKRQDLTIQVEALRKANTGLKRSDRERENIRQRMLNRLLSEETRKRISDTLKMKGIQPTMESRAKGLAIASLNRTRCILQKDTEGNTVNTFFGHKEVIAYFNLKGTTTGRLGKAVKNKTIWRGYLWEYETKI